MRAIAFLLGVASLGIASPALATGGIDCRPIRGAGPTLHLVVGHVISGGILSVQMTDRISYNSGNQRMGSGGIMIGQSWIDERVLWLDLLDPNAERFEGKLRATFQRRRDEWSAVGTFERNGRTYRMRCEEA